MSTVTTATWVQRAKVKYRGLKTRGRGKGKFRDAVVHHRSRHRQARREEKGKRQNGFRTVNMEGGIRATVRDYANNILATLCGLIAYYYFMSGY